MIVGVGMSLQSIAELEAATGNDASHRQCTFTAAEIDYCEAMRYPAIHYAARYAAKNAALQALGLSHGPWLDIQTRNMGDRRPNLELTGALVQAADKAGVCRILLSLSHTREFAVAFVVLEARTGPPVRKGEGIG